MAMKQLFGNLDATTLASAVGSSDTTITVTDGTIFPQPGADEFFLLTLFQESGGVESNHEIVKVTSISTHTLTVERAQEGTSAGTFSAGDKAEHRNTAGTMASLRDAPDTATVFTATSGAFDRANGEIQEYTMTANETFSVTMNSGQSLTLIIYGSDTYSITWPSWTWRGSGSPPDPAAEIVVEVMKVGSTVRAWDAT